MVARPTFPILVLAVLTLLRFPLAFWRGHVRERRWDLSTQTARGWLYDWAKGFAVSAVLTAVACSLSSRSPGHYRAPGRPPPWGAALLVLALGVAAAIVLEPLFNRFRPLDDPALAGELRALAEHAGVTVRAVLVADASRRTRRR